MSEAMGRPRWTLADIVRVNIRAESARRGVQQQDLAAALGWAKSSVNKRFLGGQDWKLDELAPVAQVLGCTVANLLTDWDALPGVPTEGLRPARPEGLEPPTFWSVVSRAVRRVSGGTGRAGNDRGAASGPAAPVYSIRTGERVA